ncbi:hypothetical protein PILCRDRAFT_356974 [Piloderma croceum F 1598]|uniref:Uncharacterized protein n=1 Tax=Piloderma croceum (strain F 1598) TaxID=765440 RepID=A0A0C3C6L8_PILCF|nr:hypothetical protein PILCRDRAFT_356974 [Piloderma croceum F 1598]
MPAFAPVPKQKHAHENVKGKARAENNRPKHAVSARPVEPESQRKMFRLRRDASCWPPSQKAPQSQTESDLEDEKCRNLTCHHLQSCSLLGTATACMIPIPRSHSRSALSSVDGRETKALTDRIYLCGFASTKTEPLSSMKD